MISCITDLKVSLYFAAISASTAFVQREASICGTFFAIVLALWRSLAKALWQFLSERKIKKQSPACPKFCQEMFIGCDFSSVRPRFLP